LSLALESLLLLSLPLVALSALPSPPLTGVVVGVGDPDAMGDLEAKGWEEWDVVTDPDATGGDPEEEAEAVDEGGEDGEVAADAENDEEEEAGVDEKADAPGVLVPLADGGGVDVSDAVALLEAAGVPEGDATVPDGDGVTAGWQPYSGLAVGSKPTLHLPACPRFSLVVQLPMSLRFWNTTVPLVAVMFRGRQPTAQAAWQPTATQRSTKETRGE
jgi:hypothetical protein